MTNDNKIKAARAAILGAGRGDATCLSGAVSACVERAGVSPAAVAAVGAHYPHGGPNYVGWLWAFDALVAAPRLK